MEQVAEVAGLRLVDRLVEQGDALGMAVERVGQGGALVDQRRDAHGRGADGVGHGQRLVRPFDGLDVLVAQHVGLGGQGVGAGQGLGLAERLGDGQGVPHRLPLALEVPCLPVEPGQVDEGGGLEDGVAAGRGLGVPALAVLDGQRQQPDHPGRLGGGGEKREVAVGLGQAGLGQAQRLGGGALLEVAPGAAAGGLDQLVVAPGPLGVPGHGRPVVAARLLDGGQGLLVQATALPAEQAPGDRLAGQGVPEGEQVGLLLDHHVLGHQVAQDPDQLVLAAAGDGGQEVKGDPPAEDGGGVDHPALLAVEVVEAAEDGLAEVPGQGEGGQAGRVDPSGGHHQLLQEERVAAGAPVQRLGHPERHRVAVDGGQQLGHAGPAETLEGDAGDHALALQLDQQLDQGVAAGHALGSEGADQQQRRAAGDGQAAEQGHALGVGPVQVLEHHQGPGGAGQLADQGDGGPQQLLLAVLALGVGGQLGRDRGQQQAQRLGAVGQRLGDGVPAGHPRLDRLQQQLERPAGGALAALAGQHRDGGVEGGDQLGDQAGLADAGFAADQGDGRVGVLVGAGHAADHGDGPVAGGGGELAQARQLVGAPDHHRAQPGPGGQHAGQATSQAGRSRGPGPGRAAQAARPALEASTWGAAGTTRLRSAVGSTIRAGRHLARNGRPKR